jgi:hypothetical protein
MAAGGFVEMKPSIGKRVRMRCGMASRRRAVPSLDDCRNSGRERPPATAPQFAPEFLLGGTCEKVLTVLDSYIGVQDGYMRKLGLPAIVALAMFTLVTTTAMAKITSPKPVAPVDGDGVRYSADRDGRDQYAVATDVATGKQVWKVKVFHTPIKFWIEEDVQWVFITNLTLMDNTLFVRDGRARCYAVDIKTHRVRKASCSPSFAPQKGAPQ